MKQKPYFSSKSQKEQVNQKSLVLFNDDFNSFDHVIDCLVAICEHNPIQAEQCALITHFNGKCVIKNGDPKDLHFLKNDLGHYNLDVEII